MREGAYAREEAYFKVWHFPQRLPNKQHSFFNQLNLKNHSKAIPILHYHHESHICIYSAACLPIFKEVYRSPLLHFLLFSDHALL